MSTILITLLAVVAVLLLIWQVKGHASSVKSPEDLRLQLRVIDIDAFRNLTDPCEDQFLRSHLPGSAYRRIRRQRLLATSAYISCVANNAAVLIRMGEEARRSSDASISEAGVKLMNSALRLRLQTFQLKVKTYAQLIYPGMPTPSGELASEYEQMTRQGMLLGRLQYPARGVSSVF
jgi:hypothetical protein